jgi:hypothetical protein
VTLDNCWFDRATSSFIRCDNPGLKIKITNTVVSNIGRPKDPSNGRVIDDRGNMIDTIILENSTFYNITQRIIRDGGDVINYCKIRNNTFVNVGTNGISFGQVGELELTNNIFVNFGFVPTDIFSPSNVFSIDSVTIDSVTKVAPVMNVSYNNIYLDSTLVTGYLNDTLMMPILVNPTFMAYMLESGNFVTMLMLPIEFNDAPPFADAFVSAYVNNDLANAPDWEDPEIPGDGIYHRDVPYDFGYANSVIAAGADDGLQLGDRNWVAGNSVSIKPFVAVGSDLKVYPMPADRYITIAFTLERKADLSFEVYDLTGKRVADVLSRSYGAGSHTFQWNFEGTLGKGIYLLRMKAGNSYSTAKMIIK